MRSPLLTQFTQFLLPAATRVHGGDFERNCQSLGSRLDVADATIWLSEVVRAGIQYEDLAYTSSFGFATVGANNGHNGTSGGAFYNNPEVIADFAYRSVHTGAIAGKEITKAFYGRSHKKSYYFGCSTGGRQGLKSAQDFPVDFDGIVAGAPASDFNRLMSWSGSFYTYTGPSGSPTFLSRSKWSAVNREILRQCDQIDGVADGIIEDPKLCAYKPEALLCEQSNATDCLTPEQAGTVRKVYSPLRFANGTFIYPRAVPGSEGEGAFRLYSGNPSIYIADLLRYAVYNDPIWDPATVSQADFAAAIEANPGDIESFDGDLTPFRTTGGKLLTYHGLQDGLISAENTDRYHELVPQAMDLDEAEVDDFYRHFRVSGMGHCAGGPGAWAIGQNLAYATRTPEGNVLTAMVRWVEEGVPPEGILGTKFVNDTAALGVGFQRVHCKYPLRNTYDGSGDPKRPESWECK